MHVHLTFDPAEDVTAPCVSRGARPPIAILRDQGVNGEVEMAAAFDRAGFERARRPHERRDRRAGVARVFRGLAACGGFSFGDVLGGGEGWAKSALYNARARDEFSAFFARPDTFALGVCNGCQMMAAMKELIPGAEAWPRFVKNASEQFEARVVMVEILPGPSIFFKGMEGSRIPIVTAHGEGRAAFDTPEDAARVIVSMRYVDNRGKPTELYPLNPNGSTGGLTGVTTRRRAVHGRHAAPRTGVPLGAVVLAPRRLGRGRAVDARLQERTRVPGVTGGTKLTDARTTRITRLTRE